MKLWPKFRALLWKRKLDADMGEEMRTHLELQIEENVKRGMSPEEARYTAQRQFGGVEQIKERCREQRTWVWLEQWAQDWRYAWRQIRRTPGFSAVAVLTIALGIGLVTVQFSFVYGVRFTGPRVAGAERLVTVSTTTERGGEGITSLRHFLTLRARQTSFEQFAAFDRRGFVLSGEGALPRSHVGALCSAEVFSIANAQPKLGRTLQPADNTPGAPRVVVLGWNVWQTDFGGDRNVVGRAVRMNGEPATIVGVMPAGFHFPIAEEMWVNLPLPVAAESASWFESAQIIGRLRPGVPLAQARSEVATLMASAVADAPKNGAIGRRAVMVPFARGEIGRAFEMILWTLFAMAGLVLALGCINVANLLYARALRQRHELAVRAALGASRGRLLRQMVCLSSLLAGLGAAGGVLVAIWTTPWLNPLLADPRKPYWIRIEAEWHVLAAAALVTGVFGVIAGLVPALRALRLDPGAVLHESGRVTGLISGWAGRGFATVQMALAAAVLVVGAVLARGVLSVGQDQFPPGAERILIARGLAGLSSTEGEPSTSEDVLLTRLLERAGGLPGVERVAVLGRGLETRIVLAGMDAAEAEKAGRFPAEAVSSEYFAVFGVKPLRGRIFTAAEVSAREPVVVINESCARRFWADGDPLGQRVRFEGWDGLLVWHTVIGVVPDLPMQRNQRQLHRPGIYYPIDLSKPAWTSLLLRTAPEPAALASPLRKVLQELSPDRVFAAVQPLREAIAEELQLLRLLSGLAVVFGVSGLLLAGLGVFGVQAFFVESRRREFGVRIALGARPAQIMRLVMQRGVGQLTVGLGAGLAGGWILNRLLQSTPLLRPVTQFTAGVVLAVVVVLAGAVLLACWLPARRAAKVDPMVALRCE